MHAHPWLSPACGTAHATDNGDCAGRHTNSTAFDICLASAAACGGGGEGGGVPPRLLVRKLSSMPALLNCTASVCWSGRMSSIASPRLPNIQDEAAAGKSAADADSPARCCGYSGGTCPTLVAVGAGSGDCWLCTQYTARQHTRYRRHSQASGQHGKWVLLSGHCHGQHRT